MMDGVDPHLAAWLAFYDELGLTPLYRDPGGPAAPQEPLSATLNASRGASRTSTVSTVSTARTVPTVPSDAATRPATVAPASLASESGGVVAASQSLFGPDEDERGGDESLGGETLPDILADLGEDCTRCKLHEGRMNLVFGSGSPEARVVFVGEGPGADEDAQGLPFVGRAGRLLTKWIESIGMTRDEVYICNVVKCRPPGNRAPEKDEIKTCSPFLYRQLEAIGPKLICCLGATALKALLGKPVAIGKMRGQILDFHGKKMLPLYHPAYLLRPHPKRVDDDLKQDLQKILQVLAT